MQLKQAMSRSTKPADKTRKKGKLIFFWINLITAFLFFVSDCTAQSLTAHAGNNTSVCPGDSVKIGAHPSATGGTPPYTYSWLPATGLSLANDSNPNVSPPSSMPYTLTVQDVAGNTAISVINVTVLPSPKVSAGPNQTITSGTTTQLQATGALNYFWTPNYNISNQNTVSPEVDPGESTTYCLVGVDANGCANYDCVNIEVVPSDFVLIYNAFTPNGDGVNDVLFVGNIDRFPNNKIEVFNRNGKLVYQKSPYANDWNGKVDGTNLPCATYYVVFTLGDGKGKKEAAVTIIR
jgi:gliding motility-associated-like protein